MTLEGADDAGPPVGVPRHWIRRIIGLCCLAVVVFAVRDSVVRGRALQRTAPEIYLGAAPLVGRNFRDGWDWRFSPTQLVAGALVLALAASWWRGWWHKVRVGWVVATSGLTAGLFAVLLAMTDGRDGLLYGAADKSEYYANLPITPAMGDFIRLYIPRLRFYSVHLKGHPPGFTVLLKLMAAIGLDSVWAVVALSIIGTVLLPVGVLVTVRKVAGDDVMRRCAPLLVVAPYAIWMMTSADAVYAALGALGVAAIVAGSYSPGWRAGLFGLLGGLLLGADMYGTYLTAVFFIVPAAVLLAALRRRTRPVLMTAAAACVGGLVVVGVFKWAGFWWFDGVAQTKREYWAGTAQFRTWSYFGVANLVAAGIALGPATLLGVWRLRDRRVWLLVGAGLAALLTSHLSQYTKAEVERIWLLFYPWIALAGAGLSRLPSSSAFDADLTLVADGDGFRPDPQPESSLVPVAAWIAIQGIAAIVLQAALVTKW